VYKQANFIKIKISVKQDNIDHNCKELHVKSQTFKTKTFALIYLKVLPKADQAV
jgi:hypothetical protein